MRLHSLELDKHTLLDILDVALESLEQASISEHLEAQLGIDGDTLHDRADKARDLLVRSMFSKATP